MTINSCRKRFIDTDGSDCIVDTFEDGDQTYWLNLGSRGSQLHRIDGPAFDWMSVKRQEWYLYGKRVDVNSQEEFERMMKLKAFW
jgi:hypothetical protein